MQFEIRLIGALCILLCSTAAGFLYADKLKQRKYFLSSFIDLLTTLDSSIRYNGGEIVTLIQKSSPVFIKRFFDFQQEDYFEFQQSFLKNIPSSLGLTQEDFSLLSGFFGKLGSTDIEGQLSHINLYKTLFEINLNNSLEEYKTKSRLRKTLGFFIGAVLALFIV